MATPARADPPADANARWDSTVVLGDGETVLVRALRPSDEQALAAFHRRQSPDSIYRRFFSPKPELTPAELRHFTDVDMVDRAALCVEWHGEFIAWASYERWPGRDDADTAFMVDDAHHGKGIATLLLEHLAAIATSNGIERFTAEVLADNRPMLAVFARAGWPLERTYDRGVIEVDFAIAETHEFLDSLAEREQRADSRAMARLLLPRSIAVVGASDRPDTVGRVLWRNITRTAKVPVYAVNPKRSTIVRTDSEGNERAEDTWPTVASIPDDVWLAVVAVPAAALARDDRRLHRGARARRPGRDVGRCRGRLHRRRRGAGDEGAPPRHAHHRPVEHGRRDVAPRDRPRGRARPRRAAPGDDRRLDAIGLTRLVAAGLGPAPRHGPVVVRLARRSVGRLGQRPAAVLGRRRVDQRHRDVQRDARQHPPLRPHRPASVTAPPDRGGAHGGGRDRAVGWRARTSTPV